MADKLSIILGDEEIDLSTNKQDRLAFVVRAISGLSPFGSMMAETILKIIPDQKQDRLVTFVQVLEQKLRHLAEDVAKQRLQSPEGTDLLEDALGQASRAVSDERIEYIASLLANGLSQDELEHVDKKRLFSLLEQTSDPEIIILTYHSILPVVEKKQFAETHKELLAPLLLTYGAQQEEIDQAALRNTYTANLVKLGLLRRRYPTPKKGELPEFDERTGSLKAGGYEFTALGQVFLRYIGISVTWTPYN